MKKIFTLIVVILAFLNFANAQVCNNITWEVTPHPVTDEAASVTITVTLDCTDIAWTAGPLYVWMWDNASGVYPNGSWDNSDESMIMTDNEDGTFSFTFVPTTLNGGHAGITDIGFLVKADDGSVDNIDNKTPDQHLMFNGVSVSNISNAVTIFPNPSKGIFNLSNVAEFSVMNVAGKMVLTGNGNSIDMTGFASGMYIVKVSNNNGTELRKLIVE